MRSMNPIALVAALLSSGLALASSRATTTAPPSCHEVSDQPAAYIGNKVTLLGIQRLVSTTAVEGKAGTTLAYRVTGVVQEVLEVPMPAGRFQVKKVIPYLTDVTLRAP